MPKEIALIQDILKDWNLLKQSAQKKSLGVFSDSAKVDRVDYFMRLLNINETMGIDDLARVLSTIENVRVKSNIAATHLKLSEWLDKNHYRILKDLKVKAEPQFVKLAVEKDSALFRLLIKNHKILLNLYERASAAARGELPVSQVNYTKAHIATSQVCHELAQTTRATQASDKSNSANDIKRVLVTIYGAQIHAGDKRSNRDPIILETIQHFAGDDIAKPHSRADKIFHYGGQFLLSFIADEFTNTAKSILKPDITYQATSIKGNINWSKDADTQDIFATVNADILIAQQVSEKDINYFVIGTDGTSLLELSQNSDNLAATMARAWKEREGTTHENIVPISRITAKIALVKDEQGYHGGQGYDS